MALRSFPLLLSWILFAPVHAQHGTVQSDNGSIVAVRLNQGVTVAPGTRGSVNVELKGTRMLAARLRAIRVEGGVVYCTVEMRTPELDLREARVEFSDPIRLGGLHIRPVPSDARVTVDGVGTLDAAARFLRPGSYTVRVNRTGYQPRTVIVSVEAGLTADQTVRLRPILSDARERVVPARELAVRTCAAPSSPLPPTGFERDSSVLRITSSPDSVAVRINDIVRGVTPLDVVVVAGSTVVQLESDGASSAPDSLDVSSGTWRQVHYELGDIPDTRRPGRGRAALVVSSTPAGADIVVNGERRGITPQRLELDPGAVALEVVMTKYHSRLDSIALRAGEVRVEHYCLSENLTPLDVSVYPWGSSVYINGRPAGETPLAARIPWGFSAIRVERQGYVPMEDSVFAWEGPPPEDIEETLVPKAGWLRVRSDSVGAEVRLGNVRVGETPLDLRVPPGEYEVAVLSASLFQQPVVVHAGGDETVLARGSGLGPRRPGLTLLPGQGQSDRSSTRGFGTNAQVPDAPPRPRPDVSRPDVRSSTDTIAKLFAQGRTHFLNGEYERARTSFVQAQDLDRGNFQLAMSIGEVDAILARVAELRSTQRDTLTVYRSALRESAIVDDTDDIYRIAGLLLRLMPGDPATLHLLRQELGRTSPPVSGTVPGLNFVYVYGTAERPAKEPELAALDAPQRGYLLSTTEVTNSHFVAFLNSVERGGVEHGQPLLVRDPIGLLRDPRNEWRPKPESERAPVVDATWYGARAYAEWVGGRLPTRREWLWAFSLGRALSNEEPEDSLVGAGSANDRSQGLDTTGTGGFDGLGLHDMAGNAWEWVGDSPNDSGSRIRYIMGGRYPSRNGASVWLAGQRNASRPDGDVGFRVLLPFE